MQRFTTNLLNTKQKQTRNTMLCGNYRQWHGPRRQLTVFTITFSAQQAPVKPTTRLNTRTSDKHQSCVSRQDNKPCLNETQTKLFPEPSGLHAIRAPHNALSRTQCDNWTTQPIFSPHWTCRSSKTQLSRQSKLQVPDKKPVENATQVIVKIKGE